MWIKTTGSGAGFHVLQLLERQAASAADASSVVETRARHILLRTSEQATAQQAAQRLLQLKRQIETGERRFEDVARDVSEDGSAPAGMSGEKKVSRPLPPKGLLQVTLSQQAPPPSKTTASFFGSPGRTQKR